ncbi:MAG: hypothetical protein QMD78_05580, partial [Methanocellales archaeon]|nr:hypothetical protein [Methanocellales archaeon]
MILSVFAALVTPVAAAEAPSASVSPTSIVIGETLDVTYNSTAEETITATANGISGTATEAVGAITLGTTTSTANKEATFTVATKDIITVAGSYNVTVSGSTSGILGWTIVTMATPTLTIKVWDKNTGKEDKILLDHTVEFNGTCNLRPVTVTVRDANNIIRFGPNATTDVGGLGWKNDEWKPDKVGTYTVEAKDKVGNKKYRTFTVEEATITMTLPATAARGNIVEIYG